VIHYHGTPITGDRQYRAARPLGRYKAGCFCQSLRSGAGSGLIEGSHARPHRCNSGWLPVFHATCELLVDQSDDGRTHAQLSAIRALLSSSPASQGY
jgi:hypothetical protein